MNAGIDYPQDGALRGYHGGQSAAEVSDVSYDSVLEPVLPGTMGQGGDRATIKPGGGAIRLTVSSNLNVNGMISAAAVRTANTGGGGGTVNIRAGTLTGNGSITAVGSAPFYASYEKDFAGGGGRVAVRLTGAGATFGSFNTANITASGATLTTSTDFTNALYSSSAGSVYLQTAADGEGGVRWSYATTTTP